MSELAAALRQFADRVEREEILGGATQCAIVMANDSGKTQATYIGRLAPAHKAGTQLLASGILNFATEQVADVRPATGAVMALARGSTH